MHPLIRPLAVLGSVFLVGSIVAAATPVAATDAPADAVLYEIDPSHSNVLFKVRHLGVATVTGRFNHFAGSFWYDPADPAATRITATIDAASIDTRHERRDQHLRSEDFLWAERYPTLTFESRSVRQVGDGEFEVTGDLTIRGVTRSVVLAATLDGIGVGNRGEPLMGLSATTEINRLDYGLRWNRALEAGGWLVGDEVRIVLELEARGPAPAAR